MNNYYVGLILNTSSFYMIGGSGALISLILGKYNLGGEGQIYVGGFVTAIFLSKISFLPSYIAIPISLALSFLISSLLCIIPFLLNRYKNIDFLLTSFICSSAVIPILDGLIGGPFRGNTGNLLATQTIPKQFQFSHFLKPSSLNVSFVLAILICLLTAFFIKRTKTGRQMQIFGISKEFAIYSGFSETKISFISAILSGGLHGLCGALIVIGTSYTCHSGFHSGIGWNSLSVAILSKNNPYFIIFSSLFLGTIFSSAKQISLNANLGFDLESLLQSIVIFLISISYVIPKLSFFQHRRK